MIEDAASRLAAVTMIGLPHEGLTPAFREAFAKRPFAGVLLFRRHFATIERLPALVEELRRLAAPRTILVAMDEEGGFVSQLAPELPVPPAARVLGRGASETEVERIGSAVGSWLAAAGIDVNFAPVLDIDLESRNPVIGPRAFSRSPEEVARLGAAMLRHVLVFDAYWRLARNFAITSAAQIREAGFKENIAPVVMHIILFQRPLPRALLGFGLFSKLCMFVCYVYCRYIKRSI